VPEDTFPEVFMHFPISIRTIAKSLGFLMLLLISMTACQIKYPPSIPPDSPPAETTDPYTSLSQIIATDPGSIDATEAHYRLGLLKLSERNQEEALLHFITAGDQPDHFPWNHASNIEITGMRMTPDTHVHDILSDSIERLKQAVDSPDEILHRAYFHLARWFFSAGEWTSVLDLLQTVPLTSLNPDETAYSHILKGISLSRLGWHQRALNTLQTALDSDFPDRHQALLESMHILTQTKNPRGAAELALRHPSLFKRQQVIEAFKDILTFFPDIEDLEILIQQQAPGFGVFLLHLECINRLWESGEPELALRRAENLAHVYPEYFDHLVPVRLLLENALQVNPQKIGVLVPLSGQVASIGHSIFRGAQLALSDYQQNGGTIPFTLSLHDSGETRVTATNGFRTLVEDEHVLAVIGPVRSALTESLLPLCSKYKIPLLTPGSPQENIINQSKWAFRLYPSASYDIRELVRFSVRDLGLYRFGCVYPDIDYGVDALCALESVVQSEQAELVFKRSYSHDLTNIRLHLESKLDTSVDVIIIPDLAERAGIVAGHIRYAEILTPTIAGISTWENPVLLDIAGRNLEGGYFVSPYPVSTGTRKDISNRYRTRFGEQADAFALRSYEAVILIMSAVERGIIYRSHLRNWLSSGKGLPGLDGVSRFSESGDYEPPVTVFKIHGLEYLPWRFIPVHNIETTTETVIPDQHQENPSQNQ
jgi:branched-chain amino acid transport system substrate-binding protein